jgi:hypothetical protein
LSKSTGAIKRIAAIIAASMPIRFVRVFIFKPPFSIRFSFG